MPDPRSQTQGHAPKLFKVTIPASSTTAGATLLSLLILAGMTTAEAAQITGCKVLGLKQDGTDRAAFDVANAATAASFTACSRRISLAAEWVEPAVRACDLVVRAVANATIDAIVVAYLD